MSAIVEEKMQQVNKLLDEINTYMQFGDDTHEVGTGIRVTLKHRDTDPKWYTYIFLKFAEGSDLSTWFGGDGSYHTWDSLVDFIVKQPEYKELVICPADQWQEFKLNDQDTDILGLAP